MIAALLWKVTPPRQPSYAGRTLSEWLDDYYMDCNGGGRSLDFTNSPAYFALRTIGTNALPPLLHWIANEPANPNTPLMSVADHLPRAIADSRFGDYLRNPDSHPFRIEIAFTVLGPDASPAVPELTRIFLDPQSNDYASDEAAFALSEIGLAGLPPLLAGITDPHRRTRLQAICHLGFMGTNVSVAVPAIIQHLADPDPEISQQAASALDCLGYRNAISPEYIPRLRPLLQSPDPWIRLRIAGVLAGFATERPAAIRVLKESLLNTNKEIAGEARMGLNGAEIDIPVDTGSPAP